MSRSLHVWMMVLWAGLQVACWGGDEPASPAEPPCADAAACGEACAACEADACPPEAAAACHQLGEERLRGRDAFDLAAAAAAYERACDHGVARSCASLGLQVQDGRGVDQDVQRAASLYERACELGAGVGCFNRGLMVLGGHGEVAEESDAQPWFDRAQKAYQAECEAGELAMCMNLGVLHERGFGVEQDQAEAHAIYQRACDAGHADSCANAVLMELEGAVARQGDPGSRLRAACDDGGTVACGMAGRLLHSGQYGIDTDPDAAGPLLEQACLDADADACGTLGAILGDLGQNGGSLYYEQRACDLGASSGCLYLGYWHLDQGDPEAAAPWMARACAIGAPDGCMALGAMVCLGRGQPADPDRCLALMRDACRKGQIEGCFELLRRGVDDLPVPEAQRATVRARACQQGIAAGCAPGDAGSP